MYLVLEGVWQGGGPRLWLYVFEECEETDDDVDDEDIKLARSGTCGGKS